MYSDRTLLFLQVPPGGHCLTMFTFHESSVFRERDCEYGWQLWEREEKHIALLIILQYTLYLSQTLLSAQRKPNSSPASV